MNIRNETKRIDLKKEIVNTSFNNITFAGLIKSKLIHPGSGYTSIETEPIANIDYSKELEIKNDSLNEYWKAKGLPGNPAKIKPSPKNRFYRTTSKRRVINKDGRFYLLFGESDSLPVNTVYKKSLLEPEEHSVIYDFLSGKINSPQYKVIGQNLNYIIIRGNYTEFTVIYNVHTLNAAIVRKLKILGDQLKEISINVISAFIYLDPTRSEYYLENERPADVLSFKKLFGPDKIFLKTEGKKYSYHPTSFSQVNESMIPVLLKEAGRILKPSGAARLIDLFCGYGLFSLYLADHFSEVFGIEWEGESIKSAINNSIFNKEQRKLKFAAKKITGNNLNNILPQKRNLDEFFLLDPPRQGTEKGVIKTIADRKPERVLHIFCGIEKIKEELAEWKKHNYKVIEVIPIDMFPGTPNLEILFHLEGYR